jgi:glycosyltransferase involved in cell wall biosynthesis
MIDPPRVTIVVPAYNHADHVADCIESLWAQDYPNLEIVVCDDASPDGTLAILRDMAARSPVPMILLENVSNKGVCASLNRCIAAADGDWIGMIASDDMYLPTFVSRNMAAVVTEATDMVCMQSAAIRLRRDGVRIRHRPPLGKPLDGWVMEDIALGRGWINAPSFFASRSLFDAVGPFDESLTYEDLDFYLRASRIARFRFLDTPLIIKRDSPGGLGHVITQRFEDGFRILDKNLRAEFPDLWLRATDLREQRLARGFGRQGDLTSLRRLIGRDRERRRTYPRGLWIAAMLGAMAGIGVAMVGRGTIGHVLHRLRLLARPARSQRRRKTST